MSQLNSEYDFEHAPCGYVSFSSDGTITQINQTFLKWIGYTKEEVEGIKKLEEITAKGTNLYFQMFVYPMLKMQGYINELKIDILSSDNQSTSCLFNASAIRAADGAIRQIHAILFAISDRKKYEAEILKAKKEAEAITEHKEQMLQLQRRIISIVGHDTRAPLFSVNRIIKLAADGKISSKEVFPYFELMANQLDATLILVNDLLNWSKALFSNEANPEAFFSLALVTDEVFELLSGNAHAKGLYLINDIDPELMLASNRSMITFIIRNLVNNAIKFTGSGGVTVNANRLNNEVCITVCDTGIGMNAGQLNKFMQGDVNSTKGTQNEKGSGMGLILINEFLAQLKGRLQAESSVGQGTTITILLPATSAAGA